MSFHSKAGVYLLIEKKYYTKEEVFCYLITQRRTILHRGTLSNELKIHVEFILLVQQLCVNSRIAVREENSRTAFLRLKMRFTSS